MGVLGQPLKRVLERRKAEIQLCIMPIPRRSVNTARGRSDRPGFRVLLDFLLWHKREDQPG